MNGTENMDKQIKEYGDYQTPTYFIDKVYTYIKENYKLTPEVIFEPTFGLGNFIIGGINKFRNIKKIYGIEINPSYFNYAKKRISDINKNNIEVKLFNEDIFVFNFDKIKNKINKNDNVLVIGNPPWVTNSELGLLGSENIPQKYNFKGLTGLDAITGKGNFDIAEYIILQLLNEFKDYNCHVAMLCKNIVARNIVRDLEKYDFKLSHIKMLTFNANSVFDINCEAGLLIMKLGNEKKLICDVYDMDSPTIKTRSFGWIDGNFISDIDNYTIAESIDGTCPLEWRQGIKHDCSKVMQLSLLDENGSYINGLKKTVTIEDLYLYPLLKSSDIKKYIINKTRKNVIITQKKVKEETYSIKDKSPKLWEYLNQHIEYFLKRKSSIYNNAPMFSIFGIGDYSFKPYKVGISGFYKEPIFTLAYSDKPIMFDDTCYFIGFDKYKHALITMLLLNSKFVQDFVKSIAFLDNKRPYTKDILMRINLKKVIKLIKYIDLRDLAQSLKVDCNITINDYNSYIELLNS